MKILRPLKAIRKKCLDCSETFNEIKNCPCFEDNGAIEKCFLFPYRLGHRPKGEKAEFTPIKSIRRHCLWCCCGNFEEVKDCPVKDCPLWQYRMGHNPKLKGRTNLAGVEALRKYRLNLKKQQLQRDEEEKK